MVERCLLCCVAGGRASRTALKHEVGKRGVPANAPAWRHVSHAIPFTGQEQGRCRRNHRLRNVVHLLRLRVCSIPDCTFHLRSRDAASSDRGHCPVSRAYGRDFPRCHPHRHMSARAPASTVPRRAAERA